MEIYALYEFKHQFEKLKKNNSYRGLEKEIVELFFDQNLDEFLKSGANLNNSQEVPFIKKRIKGSGGYRVYYLMIIKDDKLHLMYVHPKTGSAGAENITDEFQAEIYSTVKKAIEEKNLFKVTVENQKLVFDHVSDLEKIAVAVEVLAKKE